MSSTEMNLEDPPLPPPGIPPRLEDPPSIRREDPPPPPPETPETVNSYSGQDVYVDGPGGVPRSSNVTFAEGSAAPTAEYSPGRKIDRKDVRRVFTASTTTAAVSWEQVRRIKMMHDKIADGVDFNFNYYCLLMVASVVAALGLAVDSSTTVISSMLLSPIMGPVLGMAYGLCIWDLPLIKRSIRNEIISVGICVIFGVIIAACCSWTQMANSWPTEEMLSRGTRTTFLCGIPIAFFSGLGVAVSVLDDQTSSLVGVAISASLLPPAVNCGMLLIIAVIKGDEWSDFNFQYSDDPAIRIRQYVAIESNEKFDYQFDFSQAGLISLLLTVANVIFVALGAALMFRLKEVLPVKKKVFWDDLKVARRIYQGRALDAVTGEVLSVAECERIASENTERGIAMPNSLLLTSTQ